MLCSHHRPGTPGGRQLVRLIQWAGGPDEFWKKFQDAVAAANKKGKEWRRSMRSKAKISGLTTKKFWHDQMCEVVLDEGRANVIRTYVDVPAYGLALLEEEFQMSARAARVAGGAKGAPYGKRGGRPPTISRAALASAAKKVRHGDASICAAAREADVSEATLRRYMAR